MGQKQILIFQWDSIGKDDVVEGFKKLGFICDTIYLGSAKEIRKEIDLDVVRAGIIGRGYVFVFSTNYFYPIAKTCNEVGVPYLSWSYDSPMRVDHEEELSMDTNHVFFFDSKEAEYYKINYGCQNVYHLPLAVNADRFDKVLSGGADPKYKADVSFVGRLYDSTFSNALSLLDDYRREFLLGITDAALRTRDAEHVYSICNQGFVDWIDNKAFCDAVNADFDDAASEVDRTAYRLGIQLCKYSTNKERIMLLSMLGPHFDVKLYSDTSSEFLKNVKECGTVEYEGESPFVFKCSKINLNSTYLSIRSGIPLRCLDIMGCGGTLLSNRQKDFELDFEDKRSVLLYSSMEEAFDKCEYYINHDSEREKLAEAGKRIVREKYSYEYKLKEMLRMANLEYLLK